MKFQKYNRQLCHEHNSKPCRLTFGLSGTFLFDIIQYKGIDMPRGSHYGSNYFIDGREEFQEIKYKSELTGEDDASIRSQEQIRREQQWCEMNHITFVIRTEEDIIKGRFHMQNLNVIAARLRRYVPTESAYYNGLIKKTLKKNCLTIQDMIEHKLLPIQHELDHICYLYSEGIIQMDIENQPLDNRMEIQIFFPEAYKDGERLQHFAKDLWNAFEEVGRKHSLGIKEILMKHFMDAVFYCLKEFGVYKKQKYKPTKEDWMYSIEKIGFVQAY